jgi:putative methyltransferase (TIGR04325 family)
MNPRIQELIRQVLPPFVLAGIRRVRRPAVAPVLEYAPCGWDTPIENNNHGWDNEKVVQAEAAKWGDFRRNVEGQGPLGFSHEDTDLTITRNVSFHNIHLSYAYVLSLAAQGRNEISVLDWGGGLGHYYLLGKALLPDVRLNYHVREVPRMCEQGKALCPDVTFHPDDDCLNRKYDLVMINGSLGYFKDWKDVLGHLCGSVGKYMFLTRVLVVQRVPTFVALQRTQVYDYNSDMLTQVFSEAEVLNLIKDHGLQIVREFVVGDGPTIVGAPEQCRDCGWLLSRSAGA